jgi:hypothetical protein
VSFVNFNSKWFQSYCRAVLESDPRMARVYIKEALTNMNRRLQERDLQSDEREAITVAARYLNAIDRSQVSKAA